MTEVSWRDYVDRLLAEADRRYEQRFEANDRALHTAESALRDYKEGSNEWRDALKDANNRMATRVDVEKIDAAVRELQKAKANLDGRVAVFSAGISAVVSLLVGAALRMLG